MPRSGSFCSVLLTTVLCHCLLQCLSSAMAQHTPAADVLQELRTGRLQLQSRVAELRRQPQAETRDGRAAWADVAVFEKAVIWLLKHDEFYKPDYVEQTRRVLKLGNQRADQLSAGFASGKAAESADWLLREGSSIRGYISRVDQSIQPYALTLPAGVDPQNPFRWPLHVVLHGRANEMNEVNFIHRAEGRKSTEEIEWIQLDVYGRGSNAYRWAGETDVFEAIDDVKRRFRIDENRITLHGFSMGGAGAWHLGMHYPHLWSSVGNRSWDSATHGISLIYPNPLNPRRYIVINSGHTIHESDFKASNAWLFPRLGDIAIRRLTSEHAPAAEGGRASAAIHGEIVWAASFNASWLLTPEQP